MSIGTTPASEDRARLDESGPLSVEDGFPGLAAWVVFGLTVKLGVSEERLVADLAPDEQGTLIVLLSAAGAISYPYALLMVPAPPRGQTAMAVAQSLAAEYAIIHALEPAEREQAYQNSGADRLVRLAAEVVGDPDLALRAN